MHKKSPHTNNLYKKPTNNMNLSKKLSHKNHGILTVCMKNNYTNNSHKKPSDTNNP